MINSSMKKISAVILVCLFFSCKKDTIIKPQCPEPPIVTKQDSLKFAFVNRIGYKNDSVNYAGGNLKYFAGVCIKSGYHNINTNISNIINNCYSKNYPANLPLNLTDSIVQGSYPSYVGSHYNLQIELVWKDQNSSTVRDLIYVQKNTPLNDTVISPGDKLIKFIYPNDTVPTSNFKKIYQFP
jgi:hypothetical protein